jgi:hypothetical protein
MWVDNFETFYCSHSERRAVYGMLFKKFIAYRAILDASINDGNFGGTVHWAWDDEREAFQQYLFNVRGVVSSTAATTSLTFLADLLFMAAWLWLVGSWKKANKEPTTISETNTTMTLTCRS